MLPFDKCSVYLSLMLSAVCRHTKTKYSPLPPFHSPNETLNAIEEGVITLLAPFLCLPQLVRLSGFSTSDLGAFLKREG